MQTMARKTRASSGNSSAAAILAAAAKLFSQKGYDATSMREIAAAARVTKPTVYYHFGSKEGLFGALLEQGVSFLCRRLAEINAREADADAVTCLEDMVLASLEFAREHSDLNRFIHSLVFSPPKRHERQAIEKAFQRVVKGFHAVLSRAAAQGLLDASRIPLAELALRGCTMAQIVQYLQGRITLSREVASDIVTGFLYGYATVASQAKRLERR